MSAGVAAVSRVVVPARPGPRARRAQPGRRRRGQRGHGRRRGHDRRGRRERRCPRATPASPAGTRATSASAAIRTSSSPTTSRATRAAPISNNRWDAVYQNQYVAIATDAANVYRGSKALQFTLPQQNAELSDATDKLVNPEQDVLFLRYYSKFQPPYDVVGSSHNGSSISAHYFIDGQATPGVPADGTNKFLANLENWRGDAATPSPGDLNIYLYHPEQRSQYGDHFFPNGDVSPNTSIKFDLRSRLRQPARHHPAARSLVLLRVHAARRTRPASATAASRSGWTACWSPIFRAFGCATSQTLKIDRFGLSFHIGSNPNGQARKWYDNVVAARSYIGPIAP